MECTALLRHCCGLPRSITALQHPLRWKRYFTQQVQSNYLDRETPDSRVSLRSEDRVKSEHDRGHGSRSHGASSFVRTQSKFFRSRLSPLTVRSAGESRQFLTSDEQTIVCVHPAGRTPLEETTPLRPIKPELARQRTALTEEEVELVKKLRREDGSLWTINTLARFFNVKRVVISKVAPASLERQEELKKEEALMASMRFYRRKLYKADREMRRQKRLEEIISKNEKLASIRAHHQNSS